MNAPSKRLFFALWPNAEQRHELAARTSAMAQASGGRVIPPENLHITLAFLGSVPVAKLEDPLAAARQLKVVPFELVLDRLSWWRRQELLCLEPSAGIETLNELVKQLKTALRERGFAVEERPFRAHVTLAREVRREPSLQAFEPFHWLATSVELIESKTRPSGSVYSPIPR